AEAAISSRARVVRRGLMETLLSGEELTPAAGVNAIRWAGLDRTQQLVVIVARPVRPRVDEAALGGAAIPLAGGAGDAIEPLAVVRRDEVVVIRPTLEDEAAALSKAVRR